MTANVSDLVEYMHSTSSANADLIQDRFVKLAYLAEWRHVLKEDRQITSSTWRRTPKGPQSLELLEAMENPGSGVGSNLTGSEKEAVNYVIDNTGSLSSDEFTRLLNSTYPMIITDNYSEMDLLELVKEYRSSLVA